MSSVTAVAQDQGEPDETEQFQDYCETTFGNDLLPEGWDGQDDPIYVPPPYDEDSDPGDDTDPGPIDDIDAGNCMARIMAAARAQVGRGAADCKGALAQLLGRSGYWSRSQAQNGANNIANNWRSVLSGNGFSCYPSDSVSCEMINKNGGGIFVTQRASHGQQKPHGHVGVIRQCQNDRLYTYEASYSSRGNSKRMRPTSRSKRSVRGQVGGFICFPNKQCA
ncbi:hypothetical protein JNK13_00495 [bacterium]|nr:hypothetical protein [bacterium]